MKTNIQSKIQTYFAKLCIMISVAAIVLPGYASASGVLSNRSLTMSTSSSGAGANVTYTFKFTVQNTTTPVLSFSAQICTTAAGTCTTPAGFVNSITINQPTGLGQNSGWAGNVADASSLRMSNGSNAVNPSAVTSTVTFTNVTNPTINLNFYARLSTYSDAGYTSVIDSGAVAGSTAQVLQLTGIMPESLVFCVGTSGTDCSNIVGTSVNFGYFSPITPTTGVSVMSASTNANFGYAITISGSTLTSGANTITPMGTQSQNNSNNAPSTIGSSQFGTNVVANTAPAFGGAITGTGSGASSGGYGTVNSFRFMSGDTVASASGPTKYNTYTNSYIVNVGGDQAAGVYTTTMTYICTATF